MREGEQLNAQVEELEVLALAWARASGREYERGSFLDGFNRLQPTDPRDVAELLFAILGFDCLGVIRLAALDLLLSLSNRLLIRSYRTVSLKLSETSKHELNASRSIARCSAHGSSSRSLPPSEAFV